MSYLIKLYQQFSGLSTVFFSVEDTQPKRIYSWVKANRTFCQNKYIRPFRLVNAFRKIIHEKKRPSRQVSFSSGEDFRNVTETFRLTLLSYTVSITAKYYISAKIKGQIIYKEKNRKNINIFFHDLHKVRIRGIDFTPNIY